MADAERVLRRACGFVLAVAWVMAATHPTYAVQGWVALRQGAVVQQTDWTTCGAAAVATLLAKYFSITVDEAEVLQVVDWVGDPATDAERGLTLTDLASALGEFGVANAAFRMELDTLDAYVAEHGFPVLVHIEQPRPHYVLYVGRLGDQVAVDDPSWGERTVELTTFAAAYSGHVLIAIPPVEQWQSARAARAATLEKHAARQIALRRAANLGLTRW